MTPAINIIKRAGINYCLLEYKHDASCRSYGEEAAKAIGVTPDRIFKTLIVQINNDSKNLAVVIIPVSKHLNVKALAKTIVTKNISMANTHDAEKSTGYQTGGISPIGQKNNLSTFIDISINNFETVYVSAGKRGLQIELNPKDLISLTEAILVSIGM